MQFSKSIKNEDQTRRFSIAATEAGWEVREERNGELVKRVRCQDWHRVERARRSIAIEVANLQSQGWFEESQSPKKSSITNLQSPKKSSITQ